MGKATVVYSILLISQTAMLRLRRGFIPQLNRVLPVRQVPPYRFRPVNRFATYLILITLTLTPMFHNLEWVEITIVSSSINTRVF